MPGVMIFNAGHLFGIAKRAYDRTLKAKSDSEPHQQDALIAIVFSAAALEALINEAAEFAQAPFFTSPPEPGCLAALAQALEEIERSRGSIQLKFLVAKWMLTGNAYDKGSQPYQDFGLLFELRNALLHLRALDTVPLTDAEDIFTPIPPPPIVEKLRSRNIVAEFPPNVSASWISRISTRATARWSCNAAANMAHSLFEGVPPSTCLYILRSFCKNSFEAIE